MPTPQATPKPPAPTPDPFADLIPAKGASGASAGGDPFADLIPQKAQPGIGQTILDQGTRGLSFGTAPKLMGVIKGAEALAHGKDFTPAYEEGRDALKADYQAEESANPWTSRLSDMAGSYLGGKALLSGIAAAGSKFLPATTALVSAPAESMLGAAGKAALAGGTLGAVRGAGETYGDNMDDYAKNAAIGGGAGAVVGGLTGAAGQVAQRLLPASTAAVDAAYGEARSAPPLTGNGASEFNRLINTDPDWSRAYDQASANAARNSGSPFPNRNGLMQNGIPLDVIDETQREYYQLNQRGLIGSGTTGAKNSANAQRGQMLRQVDQEVPAFQRAREMYMQGPQRDEFLADVKPNHTSGLLALAGLATGHGVPVSAGVTALRLGNAMARSPATSGAIVDASSPMGRALAAMAASAAVKPDALKQIGDRTNGS